MSAPLNIANLIGPKPEEFFGPKLGELRCARALVHSADVNEVGPMQALMLGIAHPETNEVHVLHYFGVN